MFYDARCQLVLIYDACKVGNRAVLIYWACFGTHLGFQFIMIFRKIPNSSLDQYGRALASLFYAGIRIPEDM